MITNKETSTELLLVSKQYRQIARNIIFVKLKRIDSSFNFNLHFLGIIIKDM